MNRLTITRGLPASGKSTFARKLLENSSSVWKRVNRDDLRAMVDNGKWSKSNEKFIVAAQEAMVRDVLSRGLSAVVDDTNLAPSVVERWRSVAGEMGVDFQIEDFTHVPLDVCIERDVKREASVGEKVIRRMWRDHLQEANRVEMDPNLPKCIIVDMDGTMALLNGRSPYDASTCEQDSPNPHVVKVVKMFKHDFQIVVTSGREDKDREPTVRWLHAQGITFARLHMRASGDQRKDADIKEEILRTKILPEFQVAFCIDDRNQVVDRWRFLGLECWQVQEGSF